MRGYRFGKFINKNQGKSVFDQLFEIFKELLMYSSGNVSEALSWLTEIDQQHNITTEDYGIADFIDELIEQGYISKQGSGQMGPIPTSKLELSLRQTALDQIFDQLNKSKSGDHTTAIIGKGDENSSELKPYAFGDPLENISVSESLKNAQINHGLSNFMLTNEDLVVQESFYKAQTSTVLMIDISHSMILYGEDRITPAKKVAMALAQLITTRYPKDTLDIIVFGNDSWKVEIKDLPYLKVGPYHTNTVAGLELAMNILRKRQNPNKQILMITDGKPTCLKIGKKYYQNSFGLDKKIVSRTLGLAIKCRKLNIPITTFMIARDPYLMQFVDKFTKANNGKAFYSSLQGLGEFIFMDYKKSKRRGR